MFLDPMLATPIDVVPTGDGFVMEPKYDGWRAICAITEGGAWLYTRTGNPITSVPYLCSDLLSAFPPGTVVDGEIVDLVSERQWNRVQTICRRGAVHAPSAEDPALTLVIFDVVQLAGEDLKGLPLLERKRQLHEAWEAGRDAWAPAHAAGTFGLELVVHEPVDPVRANQLIDQGFEGVVVKDISSLYLPGVRNGGWFKVKPQADVEAHCTGTFPGDGRLAGDGWVGGLTFQLASGCRGRVGTGFTDDQRREIAAHPERYVGRTIELLHHGIGDGGALRNPVFRRVRSELEKPTAISVPRITRARTVSTRQTPAPAAASSATGWMRNYAQMGDDKLRTALAELRAGAGAAHDRCVTRGGSPAEHLRRAEAAAAERHLS